MRGIISLWTNANHEASAIGIEIINQRLVDDRIVLVDEADAFGFESLCLFAQSFENRFEFQFSCVGNQQVSQVCDELLAKFTRDIILQLFVLHKAEI